MVSKIASGVNEANKEGSPLRGLTHPTLDTGIEISENNDFWQTRAGPWCSTPQLAATRRFMCRAEPPSILFVLDGTLGGAHSLELINFVINVALMNSQNLLKATNTPFSLKVLLTCIPISNFNE